MNNPEEQTEEAKPLTREEMIELLKDRNEFIADMDNLAPITHNWIDRGLKMTCERAGHPYHEAYKRV